MCLPPKNVTKDAPNTYEYDKHFIIYPQMVWSERKKAVPTGKKVPEGFSYSSGNNIHQ